MKEDIFEKKLKEYEDSKKETYRLRHELYNYPDGFIYITCLRCYGSVNYDTHVNRYPVLELCDEYCGDNGIVDIYTNNTNPNFDTYGSIKIMSSEEIKEFITKSKVMNISKSKAILNWITPSIK